MLNPAFPTSAANLISEDYVASPEIAASSLHSNAEFDTGPERRLHPVYGEEIWQKLARAGIFPETFVQADMLEVCAGTGFLTYHLLNAVRPRSLVVNDISGAEIDKARQLIEASFPDVSGISWQQGDMHTVDFGRQFDLVIGNSFMHHFYDVPSVLKRIYSFLRPGGIFISVHEPTPLAIFVEAGKVALLPAAIVAPNALNEMVRRRYVGPPGPDVWMFDRGSARRLIRRAGFSTVTIYPWNLVRPLTVARRGLHSVSNDRDTETLRRACRWDGILNRLLPAACFGAMTIIARKSHDKGVGSTLGRTS